MNTISDDDFTNCINLWINKFNEIEFNVDDFIKSKWIINFVIKYIFIYFFTLIIHDKNDFLDQIWRKIENQETCSDNRSFLRKFFQEINAIFYKNHNIKIIELINEEKTIISESSLANSKINLLHETLKSFLGINKFKSSENTIIPNLKNFDLRNFKQDILGEIYEKYLKNYRKERGIFYTPLPIVKFIINNTIVKRLDVLIKQIEKRINNGEYLALENLFNEFLSIRILDPACGSGVFLMQVLRELVKFYEKLTSLLNCAQNILITSSKRLMTEEFGEIQEINFLKLKNRLFFQDKGKFISKIVVRQIFGVDSDENVVKIAKFNFYLEIVKIIKEEDENKIYLNQNYMLPNLDFNLIHGDSLISLTDDIVLENLMHDNINLMKELALLHKEFLQDPFNLDIIKEMKNIKNRIREELVLFFKDFLEKNSITLNSGQLFPIFWPLDFWFIYFNYKNETLELISQNGFDFIVGNPPYFSIRGKGRGGLVKAYCYDFFQKTPQWKDYFRSQSDIYYYFVMKSIELLRLNGLLGFIIESYWIENDYADRLKKKVLSETSLKLLIDFKNQKNLFKFANNDPCILICEKEKNENNKLKYIFFKKKFTNLNSESLIDDLFYILSKAIHNECKSNEFIEIKEIKQSILGHGKWVLSGNDERILLEKIEDNCLNLGDLCHIGQGVVPGRKIEFKISKDKNDKSAGGYWIRSEDDFIEVINKINNQKYIINKRFLKPLITNSGIKKFMINHDGNFLIYTIPLQMRSYNEKNGFSILNYLEPYRIKLESRYDYDGKKYPWYGYQRIQNIALFEVKKMKIFCPYRARENTFALDEQGYFGTTDIYVIVPKSENAIDIHYLLGILNSKLLTFWYLKAGKSKGEMLEYFSRPLTRFPIKTVNKEIQERIGTIVKKIVLLKEIYINFQNMWNNFIKGTSRELHCLKDLILNHTSPIDERVCDKIWVIYINSTLNSYEEIKNIPFDYFEIIPKSKRTLKLHGFKNNEKIPLLKIITGTLEQRDIIYLEMKKIIPQKRKRLTLKNIFRRTMIPNLQDKESCNWMNYLKKIKGNLLTKLKESFPRLKIKDIIFIDQKIKQLENELDAHVFKIYKLTEKDIIHVLNSLNILAHDRKDIINRFLKLHESI